jgi:molecular chaperone DnaK (HSP70)
MSGTYFTSRPFWIYLLTSHLLVVGVDFGTLNTVIAVARNRGVDVVSSMRSNGTGTAGY